MALDAHIKDKKTGKGLKIGVDGQIDVMVHQHPPLDQTTIVLPYRSYFEDNSGDPNNMAVDGSSTNVSFEINASPDYDIWIKSISVVIGDGGTPALNKFGALSALTNGVSWLYVTDRTGEYTLHDGIQTNLEFIRIGVDTAGVGTGTDAFLADVSGGGTEKSYLPIIDMSETFGMPFGLKLVKGTNDKLVFKVRDDLTGLSTFNAIAYGIRI
jgi:hypothetical protein